MLKSITSPSTTATRLTPDVSPGGPAQTTAGSFGDALEQAVSAVTAQATAAEASTQKLASGTSNVHETALELEKADVSMRLMLKARNKAIEAYQELSRMPV